MKSILSLFVVLVFAVSFVGNVPEAEAAEPSLAQCQGEPSKGTGWGTFWVVYGLLNAAGGAAMVSDPDSYDFENPRAVGIGAIVVGGVLQGIGWHKRSSAQKYNETCTELLAYKNVKPGFGLEPIAKEATGMQVVYRW